MDIIISYLFSVLLGRCRCSVQISLSLRPSTYFPIYFSQIIKTIDYMNGLETASLSNVKKQIKWVMLLRCMVQGVATLVHCDGGKGNLNRGMEIRFNVYLLKYTYQEFSLFESSSEPWMIIHYTLWTVLKLHRRCSVDITDKRVWTLNFYKLHLMKIECMSPLVTQLYAAEFAMVIWILRKKLKNDWHQTRWKFQKNRRIYNYFYQKGMKRFWKFQSRTS